MDRLPGYSTPDAVLHFKGEDFGIQWPLFVIHSQRFRRDPCPTSKIHITSDVSRDAVVQFINATQNAEFFLSRDTAYDLVVLSDEFDVDTLRARVIEWMSANESSLLISTLQNELKRNVDTTITESKIRSQFERHLRDPSLIDLPLSVLLRIVDNGVDDIHSIFDFLMRCLDRFGSSGSILFRNFDISRLSLNEINRMESDSRLNWSFIGDLHGQILCDVVSRNLRQERLFTKVSTENERLRQEISEIRTELSLWMARFENTLQRERESFRSELDSRISEVESKMLDLSSNLEGRVCTEREDISEFSVAKCGKLLYSNELIKNSDQLLVLHPEWKLPGVILRLNENRKLSVCAKIREIKRLLPTVSCSSIVEAVRAFCQDVQVSDLLANMCEIFPSTAILNVLDCVKVSFPNVSVTDVLGAAYRAFPQAAGTKQLLPSASDPLKGIIADLTSMGARNVHDRDVVIVTSSKGDSHHPKVVADLKSDDRFCSHYRGKEADIPYTRNNWICYDFKTRRIIPTHYSIRSPNHGHGPGFGNYLKSWLVEISTDGEQWVEIDRKESNSDLAHPYVIRMFEVSRIQVCRLIRLVNIGRNHQGFDCLCICGFEIFGSVIE
jgi:hypothetical protein